ncbi:helix-turn-helix transcriptional regulator [Actinomadura sp. NPDC048032]|uniref:helix-turn-helix transcriptional regulator n=1 Tax=Actinomadura sp. NPDC048032 TaxID=3155747 RepID=UPI0033F89B4C
MRVAFVIYDGFQILDLTPSPTWPNVPVSAHLQRRFTAELGVPPAAYVERVRIEAARRALAEGDEPVETLARRLGFGTGETLRRAFHRHVGVAPSDYRVRFRGTREYA